MTLCNIRVSVFFQGIYLPTTQYDTTEGHHFFLSYKFLL